MEAILPAEDRHLDIMRAVEIPSLAPASSL
jgi:hypothetical protein